MGYLYNILPTFRKDWKCILVKGIYNKEQTSPIFRNGEKTSQSSRAFSRKIFLRQNLLKKCCNYRYLYIELIVNERYASYCAGAFS